MVPLYVRNEDGRGIGARLLDRICYRREDWQSQMLLACLLRIRSSDDFGAILNRLLCMKRALLACEALIDDFGVRIYPKIR
jgi:hypothetical protein